MIILFGISIVQCKKKRFVLNNAVLFILLAAFFYAAAEIVSFYILRNFEVTQYIKRYYFCCRVKKCCKQYKKNSIIKNKSFLLTLHYTYSKKYDHCAYKFLDGKIFFEKNKRSQNKQESLTRKE